MPVTKIRSKWSSGDLIFFSDAVDPIITIDEAAGDVEFGAGQYLKGQRFGSAESTSMCASACLHRRNGENALPVSHVNGTMRGTINVPVNTMFSLVATAMRMSRTAATGGTDTVSRSHTRGCTLWSLSRSSRIALLPYLLSSCDTACRWAEN